MSMDYFSTLAAKYGIDSEEFLAKCETDEFKKDAYDDFSVAQQFQVKGYPTLILHARDEYFLLARGYTSLETLEQTYNSVMHSV